MLGEFAKIFLLIHKMIFLFETSVYRASAPFELLSLIFIENFFIFIFILWLLYSKEFNEKNYFYISNFIITKSKLSSFIFIPLSYYHPYFQ